MLISSILLGLQTHFVPFILALSDDPLNFLAMGDMADTEAMEAVIIGVVPLVDLVDGVDMVEDAASEERWELLY